VSTPILCKNSAASVFIISIIYVPFINKYE
jgi:hypothetical protein